MKYIFLIMGVFVLNITFSQMSFDNLYVGYTLQDKDSISRQDRIVIDITHEEWLSKPKNIQPEIYSFGLNFGRMFEYPFTQKFSIAFGPSIRSLHHYHNGDFTKTISSTGLESDTLRPIPSLVNYRINKLVLNYFDVNFELRIKGGIKNRFKLFLGFKGGCLISDHVKYIDSGIKYKRYNTKGVQQFNFGPTLRIGFGSICLFANYQLQPFYKNNTNQNISSFSAGISLLWL